MFKTIFVILSASICIVLANTEVIMMMKEDLSNDGPLHKYDPPIYTNLPKRARYLLHYSDWGVIGTISIKDQISGMPFTNIISLSDGPVNSSCGIPYFYVPKVDSSVVDAAKNDSMCLTVSEMETDYCKSKRYVAQLPVCARLTLCGRFVNITAPEELVIAQNAIYSRFPQMKDWPSWHDFFFAKLDIKFLWMIDFFGKSNVINVDDYFKTDPLK